MTCAVVHCFKTIEIDKNQHMMLACVVYCMQQLFKMVFKADSIGQLRQIVMRSAVAKLAQHFTRLGDILYDQHRANAAAIQGAKGRDAVLNVITVAIATMQHHFLLNCGARHVGTVDIFHQRAVITEGNTQYRQEWHADRAFLLPTAHFLSDRIHKGHVHIDINTNHGFANGIKRNVQTLFFLIQRFVKLLHFGHIHIDAKQAFDFTVFIQHPVGQRTDMPYAIFHRDTKLKLKRNPRGQRISNHIFGVLAIFRHEALIPDLPTGFDMWGNFIQIEHTLIPTDHIRLQFPFPNADPTGLIRESNALHQPFINPLGMLEIVNVFNLGDKVEWGIVAMTYQ